MHRDKTVARIALVLSVVHGALAAPAVVRQRYLEVVEDVTAASEKRNLDDESPHPGSVVSMSDLSVSDSEESASHLAPDELDNLYFTRRSSPSRPNRDLTTPVSGALQMRDDLPSTSGTLPSQDGPPPAPGTPQLHNDPPPTSGAPSLQDHPSPASGDPQLHNGPQAGSGTPQLHNDSPPTSGIPPSRDDPSPESGHPQLHNDPTPSTLGTPQVHDDLPPQPGDFDDSYRWLENSRHVEGATWLSHSESEALGAQHPTLQSNAPGVPHPTLESDAPGVPHPAFEVSQPTPGTQQATNSEADRFFNDALKRKLLIGGGALGAASLYMLYVYSVNKLIDGGFYRGSKPASRDLAISDVVGRGASMHLRSQKRMVSRALARTRSEDLRLLRALTGRTLERLD